MKVSQKKFTEAIEKGFQEREIHFRTETVKIAKAEPLIKLSDVQLEHLLKGDGQNGDQYKQINSSTGLVVNYFKLLESTGRISDLDFEVKVARPLNGKGGKDANLDVSFITDGKLFYVESKFLEPYYSGNETNRDAYFDPKRYAPECKSDINSWIKLFKDADTFKVYNVSQLCRHLLAIYRKSSQENFNTSTVLQSITWSMTDKFLAFLNDDVELEEMMARREELDKEAKNAQLLLNNFIKTIKWTNMSFEVSSYNDKDVLNLIEGTKEYNEFLKRYFLD